MGGDSDSAIWWHTWFDHWSLLQIYPIICIFYFSDEGASWEVQNREFDIRLHPFSTFQMKRGFLDVQNREFSIWLYPSSTFSHEEASWRFKIVGWISYVGRSTNSKSQLNFPRLLWLTWVTSCHWQLQSQRALPCHLTSEICQQPRSLTIYPQTHIADTRVGTTPTSRHLLYMLSHAITNNGDTSHRKQCDNFQGHFCDTLAVMVIPHAIFSHNLPCRSCH